MDAPFARVSYSERDNFINYLAKTPMYRTKLAFVQGNGSDIPNSVWTNGEKFAEVGGNTLDTETLYILISEYISNNVTLLTSDDVKTIIKEYIDVNNNGIWDWEEYHDEHTVKPSDVWEDWEA